MSEMFVVLKFPQEKSIDKDIYGKSDGKYFGALVNVRSSSLPIFSHIFAPVFTARVLRPFSTP